MKMVFEDNPEANLSKLLLYAYDEESNIKNTPLLFSLGDKNIIHCIQEDGGDAFIVFLDVVPDNASTIEEYRKCDRWRKLGKKDNVFLVPIPCIEYYAVKSFIGESTDASISALRGKFYKNVAFDGRRKKLSTASYEKYCKSVLYNHQDCMGTEGGFYMADCLCAKKKRQLACKEYQRLEKAWDLVLSLPIVIYHGRSPKQIAEDVTEAEIERRMVRQYYELARNFLKAGYIAEVLPLEGNVDDCPSLV